MTIPSRSAGTCTASFISSWWPAVASCATILGLGALASPLQAAVNDLQPTLVVDAEEWFTHLTGQWRDFSSTTPAGAGDVDASDVGVNGTKATPVVDVHLALPFFEVFAGGFVYHNSGNGSEPSTISFAGNTYPAGTGIGADLNYEDGYAGIAVKPIDVPEISLALGLDGHVLSGKLTLDGASGQSATFAKTQVLPAVYARAMAGPLFGLSADATVQAMTLNISDVSIRFVDADIGMTYTIFPLLGVRAGYKYYKADLDDTRSSEKKTDVMLSGLFAGLSLRF